MQTPSYITELIISNYDGGSTGVKNRYLLWVKHQRQSLFNSEKREAVQKELWDYYTEHLKEITDKSGDLDFYAL